MSRVREATLPPPLYPLNEVLTSSQDFKLNDEAAAFDFGEKFFFSKVKQCFS